MKKLLVMLIVVAVVGVMAVSAQAAVFSDFVIVNKVVDTYGWTPFTNTASWTHDISDELAAVSPATLNDATVHIAFLDAGFDRIGFVEYADILGDGATLLGHYEVDTEITDFAIMLSALDDNQINMSVVCTSGGFYIGASCLEVDYTKSAPVPEPASMALLGLGLLGVFARRKK